MPSRSSPRGKPPAILAGYRERLRDIERDQPLFFHTLEDYGPDRRLKAGIEPRTPAQHRGPRRQRLTRAPGRAAGLKRIPKKTTPPEGALSEAYRLRSLRPSCADG